MVPRQMLLQMAGYAEVHTVCSGQKAGETVKTAVHDLRATRPIVKARP